MPRSNGRRKRPGYRGGGPHPIDVHVGSRVRLRRNMLALTQEKLGEAIGLTFQQVQKYERGANRIGAGRLLEIARVLDVPVSFFYDDVDPVRAPPLPEGSGELATEATDLFQRPETVALVAAYYEIPDPKIRHRLFELAKVLSETGGDSLGVAGGPRRRRSRRAHLDSGIRQPH